MERREIKSRDTTWARLLAGKAARAGITPNQISIASIFFAFLCFVTLALIPSINTNIILVIVFPLIAVFSFR